MPGREDVRIARETAIGLIRANRRTLAAIAVAIAIAIFLLLREVTFDIQCNEQSFENTPDCTLKVHSI